MEKIGAIAAIKEYFGQDSRPVTMEEIKAIGAMGVKELGPLCATALGKTLA